MNINRLKLIRIAISVAVLGGLTLAFVGSSSARLTKLGSWLAAIQFIPSMLSLSAGVSLSLACVVVLAATLLFGRVYCSFICPLGALQDAIARIGSWRGKFGRGKKKQALSYAEPVPHIRAAVFLITILGVVSGWSGLVLSLLDPYSNFGRIASNLFRPLLRLGLRVVPWAAQVKETASTHPATTHWVGLGAILFPLFVLGLLSVMAGLRGRLYCNTICPVGTLLGFVSRYSALRLEIDLEGCRKCQRCVRACKAQCIEPRTGSIDASRCVSCYNCIPVCSGNFIGHRWSWGRRDNARAEKTIATASAIGKKPLTVSSPQRRAVMIGGALALVGAAGGERLWASDHRDHDSEIEEVSEDGRHLSTVAREDRAIRPPGSIQQERFLSHCTACELCISSCPTHVLQPSSSKYGFTDLLKPHLDYPESFCDYDCNRCGEVCPSGALSSLSLVEKRRTRIGLSVVQTNRCVVQTKQRACSLCVDHCPTKAIEAVPFGTGLHLPRVKALLCIGCGRCEHECPVEGEKAITVFGLLRETHIPIGAQGRPKETIEGISKSSPI